MNLIMRLIFSAITYWMIGMFVVWLIISVICNYLLVHENFLIMYVAVTGLTLFTNLANFLK